jgi:hypothetical protein
MRTISFLIGIVMAAVVVGLRVNPGYRERAERAHHVPRYDLPGKHGWRMVGAMALGFLLAVLLLSPGWLGRRRAPVDAGEARRANDRRSRSRLRRAHMRVTWDCDTSAAVAPVGLDS